MILRDARPMERQALEDLQRRASLMWDNDRPYLLANPEAIELPLAHIGRTRVAEEAGTALGFCVVLHRGEIADLDGLFVEPRHWRRGIGRHLVEDAMARAAAAGSRAMEVVGNDSALGFYARLGFAVCGLAQTQFGPANRLRLILKTG